MFLSWWNYILFLIFVILILNVIWSHLCQTQTSQVSTCSATILKLVITLTLRVFQRHVPKGRWSLAQNFLATLWFANCNKNIHGLLHDVVIQMCLQTLGFHKWLLWETYGWWLAMLACLNQHFIIFVVKPSLHWICYLPNIIMKSWNATSSCLWAQTSTSKQHFWHLLFSHLQKELNASNW